MSTGVAQRAGKVLVMKQRQRSVRSDIVTDVERPWIDAVLEVGIIGVRDLLIAQEVSPSRAAGIAVWLDDQANLRRLASPASSQRYRRELRELTPPGPSRRLRAIPGQFKVLSRAA